MIGRMKGIGGPPLSFLHKFYRQKVSMTFLCAHVFSILGDAIALSEGSSKLTILSRDPPFIYVFHNM
jgi:hypothetical protein